METVTMHLAGAVPGGTIHRSGRTAAVAAMFGLGLDAPPHLLFRNFALALQPATVILITGPSGSGKTTLLRAITAQLSQREISTTTLSQIALPADRAVVDCFPAALETTLAHLSRAGLSEARILLRAPAELSEGQQFRYRIAQFLASDSHVLVADEFAATLDRITARLLSWQLQKFIHNAGNSGGKTVLAATTHDDLALDLCPDLEIYKDFGEAIHVRRAGGNWNKMEVADGLQPDGTV